MASAVTLPQRLGLKVGQRVALLRAPTRIEHRLVRNDAIFLSTSLRAPSLHVVVLFVDRLSELERRFGDVVAKMTPETSFWVAWKQRGSRLTGISRDVVRRIGRAGGLVANKQCVLDGGWHGLRLVVREENRAAIAYRCEPKPAQRRTKRAPAATTADAAASRRRG